MALLEVPIITAEITVGVNARDAKAWFLSLEQHPERYQFETHAGFKFTKGNFGQPGARFETRETFLGLTVTLRFELTDVSAFRFRFRLRHLPVWGAFNIEEQAPRAVRLSLKVGASTRSSRVFLRLPLVRRAIQRQIQGEVDNIKASMEFVVRDLSRHTLEA